MERVQYDGHQIQISIIGRICANIDPITLTLEDDLHWTYEGTTDEIECEVKYGNILSVLKENEGITWTDLKKRTELPKSTLSRYVNELIQKGKIRIRLKLKKILAILLVRASERLQLTM